MSPARRVGETDVRTRRRARVALLVLCTAASVVVIPAADRSFSAVAVASDPTPLHPNDLLPGSRPSPSPSPTPSGTPRPAPTEAEGKEDQKKKASRDKDPKAAVQRKGSEAKRTKKNKRKKQRAETFVYPSVSYDTSRLVAAGAHLRSLYAPTRIQREAFVPFIVEGPATWADTWGAPRSGPGRRVRKHKGQDVFCDAGARVMAPVAGRVQFDVTPLGGKVARLFTADGSYLYFAHLSAWNERALSSGDRVRPGETIGFCGNSGNAHATPPHVHLGWYRAGGIAPIDPHEALVGWLRTAEQRAEELVSRALKKNVRVASARLAKHRFGATIEPSLTLITCSQATKAAYAMSWHRLWPAANSLRFAGDEMER